MRIIMLGAPGAGKGTQAIILAEKLNIPHISTGDIFRANIKNGTELGKKAKEFMDKGLLVPDELTVDLVKDRIQKDDCNNGFILDGFPRTIPQAEFLDNSMKNMGIELDAVLNVDVKDEVILNRLSGRRTCPACGATFHISFNKPKVEGICDACGAKLMQRDDDKEETILQRLDTYHNQTEPLVEYYTSKGKLVTADGHGTLEETIKEVQKALGI